MLGENVTMTTAQDRLEILAQLCHDQEVNPSRGNYAAFVRSIICGRMFLSNQTAIQITKTLTTAYYHDKWQSLLKTLNNGTVPPAQPEPPGLQTQMWNPQPQKEADEPKIFTSEQKAKVLYQMAKRDTYNYIGRITFSDANEENLSLTQAMEIWKLYNKKYEIEERGNCLLIYWDSKAELRSQRDLLKTVQPIQQATQNLEGDIYDDTYDSNAPGVMET